MLYKTANYTIDTKALTISCPNGEQLAIRPKTCQFLLALMFRQGEPVDKQTLLAEVWPDSVVEEQVVFQSVNELRQLFKDEKPIKTIPKKGYVWLPEVVEIASLETNKQSTLVSFQTKYLRAFLIVLCIAVTAILLFNEKQQSTSAANNSEEMQAISGSVVILPTTNRIAGNDHSWVRLGIMDQLIQRLPSNEKQGVLQTDYVLEVLERAGSPLSDIESKHINQIFTVSGADLIVSTKLSGSPHDYQLSYALYRPHSMQKGVLFGKDAQLVVDQLSVILAGIIGEKAPLNAEQYYADFNNQMLGVAIDFRLENNHEAAIPLLEGIIKKEPENFTAYRLLIESLLATRKRQKASDYLDLIMPIAKQKADAGELVRLMYFQALSYATLSETEKAKAILEPALVIAKENYDWLFQAYLTGTKAQIAEIDGDFSLAEDLYYETMRYHNVLKCPVGETDTWINLALLAKKQSQVDKQKFAFEKALSIATKRELHHQITYIKSLNE